GGDVPHYIQRIVAARPVLPGAKLVLRVARELPGEIREAGRNTGACLAVAIDASRYVFLDRPDGRQHAAALNEPVIARRRWQKGAGERGIVTRDVLHLLLAEPLCNRAHDLAVAQSCLIILQLFVQVESGLPGQPRKGAARVARTVELVAGGASLRALGT